jgi:hypothetical protein
MNKAEKWFLNCQEWCHEQYPDFEILPVTQIEGDILMIFCYCLEDHSKSVVVNCNYWYPNEYIVYKLLEEN